jgi:membrane-associated phospholipid phosphatase
VHRFQSVRTAGRLGRINLPAAIALPLAIFFLAVIPARALAVASSTPATASIPAEGSAGPWQQPGAPPAIHAWHPWHPLLLLGAGGILAAVTWDEVNARGMAEGLQRSFDDTFADAGNTYGNGWFLGGSTAMVLAAGQLADNESLKALGADLCRSLLANMAVTLAIKSAVNRRRPSVGGYSFPSGHTSTAFSVVPVIAHHLGWRAGLAASVLAIQTGLGRLEEQKHYMSDVIFGAAVGLAVGDLVVQRRSHTSWLRGLAVAPASVSYTWRF